MSELGEILHAARQKKNLTTADVAQATHIKQNFIEALEHGEYTLLPGPAYVTGFLRNYATFLGLNADDLVEEYYTLRPPQVPSVKAATRVLASGYERHNRKRLFWTLGVVILLVAVGFVFKQYNDENAHASSSTLNLTPSNIGAAQPTPVLQLRTAQRFQVQLQAIRPVWVRVTVDGRRVFQGKLQPQRTNAVWPARSSVVIATYNGLRLEGILDGRPHGLLGTGPGLVVEQVTHSGWQRIS